MQVSGHIIRSRYMFVRQAGEDAYQRVLAAVSTETREVLEQGPLETLWYPFDLLIDLSVTADRLLGEGDLRLCFEMGRFSCGHNLTGIYRVFFRFGNLNFLLDRAAKAWHSQYDFGRMSVHRDPSNKQRVTMVLEDVPRPHQAIYQSIYGWATKAAELSGTELTSFTEGFSEDPSKPSTWTFEYL